MSGVAIYSAIDKVMADDELKKLLSPVTVLNVGSYLTGAFEVAASGGGGLDNMVSSIGGMALDIAMDLTMDLVTDLIGGLADIIPVLGGFLKVLVKGIVDLITGSGAEMAQKVEQAEIKAKCRLEMQKHGLGRPTSMDGEYVPSDYWIKLVETYYDTAGKRRYTLGGTPYLGAFLNLITDTQINSYWATKTAKKKTLAKMFGVPVSAISQMGGIGRCSAPVWPTHTNFIDVFRTLGGAIVGQSFMRTNDEDIKPRDGGRSVWPIYMDLLHGAMEIPRWPWGNDAFEGVAGYKKVSALSKEVLRTLYGGKFYPKAVRGVFSIPDHPPYKESDRTKLRYTRQKLTGILDDTWLKNCSELDRNGGYFGKAFVPFLENPCYGSPNMAIDTIRDMAQGWDITMRPFYAMDKANLAADLRQGWNQIATGVRGQLGQLGLSPDTSPTTGETLEKLAKRGVISKQLAAEAGSFSAQQGADDGGMIGPVLAAGLLGLFLWQR